MELCIFYTNALRAHRLHDTVDPQLSGPHLSGAGIENDCFIRVFKYRFAFYQSILTELCI